MPSSTIRLAIRAESRHDGRMREPLVKANRAVQNLSGWLALPPVVAAALSWLGKKVTLFGPLGWPEAIFLGIATTLLTVLFLAAGLASWRYFKGPVPVVGTPLAIIPTLSAGDPETIYLDEDYTEASALRPCDIYVGESQISVGRLAIDHILEISMRLFNGSDCTIDLSSVRGNIDAVMLDENRQEVERIAFSPPTVLWDRGTVENVPSKAEFMLVIDQSVTPTVAEKLASAIDIGSVQFYLTKLIVMVSDAEKPKSKITVKLWDGMVLSKSDQFLRSGRLMLLSMKPITLSISVAPL